MTESAETESKDSDAATSTELVTVSDDDPTIVGLPGTDCTEGFTLDQCSVEAAWKAVEQSQNAAQWTTYGFFAGLAGMLVAALAVFFAWKAFEESKKANEISRKSALRQDRAYLDFYKLTFEAPKELNGTDKWGLFRIELKNFGATPAFDLTLTIRSHFYEIQKNDLENIEVLVPASSGDEDLPDQGALMQGDEWGRTSSWDLTDDIVEGWKEGKYGFSAAVTVQYLDVFEQTHSIAATFRTLGDKNEMGFITGTRVFSTVETKKKS